MTNVRFVEHDNHGQIIDDVDMPHVPMVGETIRFRFPDRTEITHIVVSVEYVIDVKLGLDVKPDRCTFVLCGLRAT